MAPRRPPVRPRLRAAAEIIKPLYKPGWHRNGKRGFCKTSLQKKLYVYSKSHPTIIGKPIPNPWHFNANSNKIRPPIHETSIPNPSKWGSGGVLEVVWPKDLLKYPFRMPPWLILGVKMEVKSTSKTIKKWLHFWSDFWSRVLNNFDGFGPHFWSTCSYFFDICSEHTLSWFF